jgi:hypothetical protein
LPLAHAPRNLLAVHRDRGIGDDANADAIAHHGEDADHDHLFAELDYQLLVAFAG